MEKKIAMGKDQRDKNHDVDNFYGHKREHKAANKLFHKELWVCEKNRIEQILFELDNQKGRMERCRDR